MKKTLIAVLASAFFTGIFLPSCGAGKLNSTAEETATAFYTQLQKKQYDSALTLCSSKAFSVSTKEDWINSFKLNAGLLGEIKSFTKTSGFNIEASTTNGTTVKVIFDVLWQYGRSKDSVMLVKEKDGSMKVYMYTWKHSDTKYAAALNESEKQATEYFAAIKNGHYDAATAFCSNEALAATPKEKWVSFLQNAAGKLGTINEYNVVRDSSSYNIGSTGKAGKGNYYDIFMQTKRTGGNVMEKIVFFQKDYNEPVKLAGHYFL